MTVGGVTVVVTSATTDTVLFTFPPAASLVESSVADVALTCPSGTATLASAVYRDPALVVMPAVIDYSPQGDVTGLKPAITVRFNRSMDEASLAAAVGLEGVAGTVVYTAETQTVTFTPDADLVAGQGYVAFVRGGLDGVKSPLGGQLGRDVRWLVTPRAEP